MKYRNRLLALVLSAFLPANAAHSSPRPKAKPEWNCPDQRLTAIDLFKSRSSRQQENASQSGIVWIPLDSLAARSPAQRREVLLKSVRAQIEGRHSTLDMKELDRVLGVMRTIPRELFVPPAQRSAAYLPLSVDIGFCQTLSDAYIVALMTSAAHVGQDANVLDVGTGSGYQAALLARLAKHVQSVEIVPQLAEQARNRLRRMGYRNVNVVTADGYAGWPPRAPFDVIIVAAGSTSIPQPLLDQLKPGGRLIMPVGPTVLEEELVVATRNRAGAITRCTLGLAAFVPMTGQAQGSVGSSSIQGIKNTPTRLPWCYTVAVS